MHVAMWALVAIVSSSPAFGGVFNARQEVIPIGDPAAPVVIRMYSGGLPPDGRYVADVAYASSPTGPFIARGTSDIDVDLRRGSFGLSASAVDSCYRSPVCGDPVVATGHSRFDYLDTITITAPGASPTDVNFVEFVFAMSGGVGYANAGGYAQIDSSLGLRDSANARTAASASISRNCNAGAGCTGEPSVTLAFDPSVGSDASATTALTPFGGPDDRLRIRIPVVGQLSVLELALSWDIATETADADFLHGGSLSLMTSPGLIMTSDNGYLLQPRIVMEPTPIALLFMGGLIALSIRRRTTIDLRIARVTTRSMGC